MNARHALRGLLLALSAAALAAQAGTPVTHVAGEPARAPKAQATPDWRLADFPTQRVARVAMDEIDLVRVQEVQKRNARGGNIPTQIGIDRELAAGAKRPALAWQAVPGGSVARFEISSPDALGLRLGLHIGALPAGAELRFAGSADLSRVLVVPAEEAKQLANAGQVYWTPVTDGERQVVEVFVPTGASTRAVALDVPRVSHLLTNSIERFSLAKAIGESGTCNVDTACRVGTLGQNFVNAKNAVARMVFTDGGTFTCTGTLLNDTVAATQIPYFYTADHCISSQAVANTLNTYWGFEATSCNSGVAAANVQLSGGADYLYSEDGSTGTDGALLRLKSTPPAGAFFAGWNAATLANGTSVLAIHHPAGDLKKSSLGQKISQDTANHEVGWTSGTTEGGSSGSGLFTLASGGYELRGGLYGGFAACENSGNLSDTDNRDYYSRLDLVYPHIEQYLNPAATGPGPSRDNSGAWFVPTESGWGITAFQYPSDVLLVLWYVYDSTGKPNWYQLDGSWTGTDINSGPVRKYSGPNWGPTFNAAAVSYTNVGTATITFTSATSATFTYTVEGQTRTVTLSKLGS